MRRIPSKILSSAKETLERIELYDKEGDSFRLLFLTDIHTGGNENYRQYSYISTMAQIFRVSLAINGGDLGLDLDEDLETANFILNKSKEGMDSFPCPSFTLKGNHDYGNQKIPNDYLNRLMNEDFAKNPNAKVVFEPNGGQYGTYWDEATKTKIIFLNTTEGDRKDYYVSHRQLAFLIENLSFTRKNENILIFSHFNPDDSGQWQGCGHKFYSQECFVCLRKILKDFVNRKNGTCKELAYSFSNIDQSVVLIGCFCGDSHFNNHVRKEGVLYVVRQGFGGVPESALPTAASKDVFDSKVETNFDILVVRKDGGAKLFRVGAGGNKRDLELCVERR